MDWFLYDNDLRHDRVKRNAIKVLHDNYRTVHGMEKP